MATIEVSGLAQLTAALKTVKAGDRLVLADGDYGALTMTADYDEPVTIAAKNPLGARFDKISLTGATNLHFDGLEMTQGFSATSRSSGITVTNSSITGTLYFRDSDRIVAEGNEIDGGLHAVLINSVTNFEIRGNLIRHAQEDLMRITGNSYNGLVEANSFRDMLPEDYRSSGGDFNHADAIQMFGANGITPHDIVIRGNHIWDDITTGASTVHPQGIFLSDATAGGYRNILIEDNLISVRSTNSIYINGGQENVVVRNNTLMPTPGDGGAIIRLANKSGFDNSGVSLIGNVFKLLSDETGKSYMKDNFLYGRNADFYALFSGTGGKPEDFLAPEGTPIPPGAGAAQSGAVYQTDWDRIPDGTGGGEDISTGGLYGTGGDDILFMDRDTELAFGNTGFDLVAYSNLINSLDVAADLRNLGITSAGGETPANPFNAELIEIEGVIGSRYNDSIIGDDGDNWLIGGGGDDLFNTTQADRTGSLGSGGNDVIIGDRIRLDDLIGRYSATLPGNLTATGLLDIAGVATFPKHFAGVLALAGNKDLVLGGDPGAAGYDTVIYSGNRRDYQIQKITHTLLSGSTIDAYRIADLRPGAPDGTDLVTGVEAFRFADATLTEAMLLGGPPVEITWNGVTPSTALPGTGATVAALTAQGGDSQGGFAYTIVGPANGFAVNATTGVVTRTTALAAGSSTTLQLSTIDTDQSSQTETFVIAAGTTAANAMTAHVSHDSVLYGFDGNDTLTGQAGDDVLFGQNGNDLILGGDGNDTLAGGPGFDSVFGGAGNDVIRHTLGESGGVIDGGSGTDTLEIFGTASSNSLTPTLDSLRRIIAIDGNTLSGIERIVADTGAGTDTLSYVLPTGLALDLTVNLETGAATGFSSIRNVENVTGNAGNDRLTGNGLANLLQGGAGNDSLVGGAGNDTLSGGTGDDTLNGGTGTDLIYGGDGDDLILYAVGDGAGTIDGGAGSDTLSISSGAAADVLTVSWTGSAITDFTFDGLVNTVTGVEAITARLGTGTARDTLAYSADSAAVTANLSTKTASGFTLIDQIENLAGGNGNDRLTGDGSNTRLFGGAGNDLLYGGGGYDTLTGGPGADTMSGGDLGDYFCFDSVADMGLGAGKRDVITDFGTGDHLDFSAIDADPVKAGDQAFTFLGTRGAAFTASGQIRWDLIDTDGNGQLDATLVQINYGGSLAADYEVLLLNRTAALTPGYLIL